MRLSNCVLFFVLFARVAAPAFAGSTDERSIAATPVPNGAVAIQIDGHPTEDAWTKAPVISAFVQRRPAEGAAPTLKTEARVLFDHANLYVAITAFDPEPSRVVGLLTRRDDISSSDWLSVYIDSYHDHRTAYEFGVNPAGVKYDRYWFNDTNSDISWDAVWDAAVSRSADGWRAEFRIPFSQLRFNPSATTTFGFALGRILARADEACTWPLLARSASGFVSSFGELTGLTFGQPLKKFEFTPYALGQLTTQPVAAGNPLTSSPAVSATGGLDMKYAVAPGLTLTTTVNPDFGQVEADPAVVNLSGFETFFPEKRPFFVEGSGNFSFNIDCDDGACTGLFYSRRIGRAPHRSVDAPDEGFVASPDHTTILGAGKLSGRIGKFSIGALSALTTEEHADIAAPPPGTGAPAPAASLMRSETPVEPTSYYNVVRVTREFANQSRIGVLGTSTTRQLVPVLDTLPSSALTGGVDVDLRVGGAYSLTGYLSGSTVRGSADAIDAIQTSTVHSLQRPDASSFTYDPTRTSLGGHAGSFAVNKIAGQRLRFSSWVGYKTPGFDINDVGFLSRADDISQSNWLQIRSDVPNRWRRSISINFNQWSGYNFDGDHRYSGGNVNGSVLLASNWSVSGGVNYNGRGFNDRLTRGGPGGYGNSNLNGWSSLSSDSRKPTVFTVSYNWLTDHRGTTNWSTYPGVTIRPRTGLFLTASLGYSVSNADTQWVENVVDGSRTRYVFGRIAQKTVSVTARVNYTISPTLTLQVYAQPFVSSGAYSHFKELTNGRAARYEDRYAPYAYAGTPDFNYRSFRTTNVLRWEYRPGSALFVVWQQGREDAVTDGRFDFQRDVRDLFRTPGTNVFLVKFSRWLNF